jgi:hypothetical protein
MDNPETLTTLGTQGTGQINVIEIRMDNPETLTTLGTEGTGQINVIENRMDNPETLTTLGTLDTFDSLKVTSYLMVFGLWCLVPLNNISVIS